MKKFIGWSLVIAFVITGTLLVSLSYAQKEFTAKEQALFDEYVAKIQSWGKDPKIVAWTKQKNATGETLAQINERDKVWMATPGLDKFMRSFIENDCGDYVREFQKKDPAFREIFVMDINGALVGESDKTSDYNQGDEDKHIKTAQVGGAGATFIDKIKFDESTQAFTRQISVPVVDPDTGKAIGAITVGVDVSLLKKLAR